MQNTQATDTAPKMRVVIIDDVLPNAMLFKISVMKVRGVEPFVFTNPLEALDWCRRNQADLVLVDYEMPEMKGSEAVTALREMPHMADVPIVMVTSHYDAKTIVLALKAGADDFMAKPVEDILLQARTRSLLRLRSLKRDLLAARKKLTLTAGVDALTSLHNRAAMLETLDAARHAAILNDSDLAVFLVDVDHMSKINATYGFAVGDRVLKAVTDMLLEIAGAKAEYGRVGSDEFLIFVPRMDTERAAVSGKRILASSQELVVEGMHSPDELTVSVAVSEVKASDHSCDTLLLRLEGGIHSCHEAGGNTIIFV